MTELEAEDTEPLLAKGGLTGWRLLHRILMMSGLPGPGGASKGHSDRLMSNIQVDFSS